MAGVVKGPASTSDVPVVEVRVNESRFVRTLIVDGCPFCGLSHCHTGGLSSAPLDPACFCEVAAGCSGRLEWNPKKAKYESVGERRYVLKLAGVEGSGVTGDA